MEELAALLDVHDVVTFRWYAQQMDLPVEQAKAELQQYADSHASSVNTVYLIGGRLKSDGGSQPRSKFQLVQKEKLSEIMAAYDSCTSHVYSVHKAANISNASMWNLSQEQDEQLFQQLKRETNCLLDNRWSNVKCTSVAKRAQRPAAARPPPQPAPPQSVSTPVSSRPAQAPPLGSASESATTVKRKEPTTEQESKKRPAPAGGVGAMFAAKAAQASSKSKLNAAKPTDSKGTNPLGLKPSPLASSTTSAKQQLANSSENCSSEAISKKSKTRAAVVSDSEDEDALPNESEAQGGREGERTSSDTTAVGRADPAPPPTSATAKPLNLRPAGTVKPSAVNAKKPKKVTKAADVDAEELAAIQSSKDKLKEAADGADVPSAERKESERAEASDKKREGGERLEEEDHKGTKRVKGSDEDEYAGSQPDEADVASAEPSSEEAPSKPRVRMVKERVREERTYMDERGYMVCEEVWVEKEVEREVPPSPPRFIRPASASVRPASKPSKSSSSKGIATFTMDDAEDEEPQKKARGKAGGKEAKPKVDKKAAGMQSMMSFFGKK
ncbi:hypothetical protein AB1Y20_022575 [Prymnesium parvum]|uniref:DNA polymerase delta subunit 3 n=1 Tax=Prymnesium parvum TaxID=97485 RepID=A0AB34JK08_PRYPA